jgi:hypothetical protein
MMCGLYALIDGKGLEDINITSLVADFIWKKNQALLFFHTLQIRMTKYQPSVDVLIP